MNTMISDFREVLAAEIPHKLLKQVSASICDEETGDFFVKYHKKWYCMSSSGKWVEVDDPIKGYLEAYRGDEVVFRGQVKNGKRYM